MQKKTPDYDNVFKTMEIKRKRLFIPVINDIFGKNYPMDTKVEALPSEGYLTESETVDGSKEIEELLNMLLLLQGSLQYGILEMQMLIEMGQEEGLDDTVIIKRLQEKIGVSFETAMAYLAQYGKHIVACKCDICVYAVFKTSQHVISWVTPSIDTRIYSYFKWAAAFA